MFGLNLKGIKGKEAEDIAMKYIKMVQLEDFVDHYPKGIVRWYETACSHQEPMP